MTLPIFVVVAMVSFTLEILKGIAPIGMMEFFETFDRCGLMAKRPARLV